MAGRTVDDLDRDYAEAGFGNRLGFGQRPALIVIDFVVAYLDQDSPLYAGVEDALAVNEQVVAAARAAGIPVIFTNVEYEPGGLDGGVFYRKIKALTCFDRGNPLGAFPPTLAPQGGELVITKQYASAFFGTTLASTLTALGCDTTILTGLSTSGCVRATALDALQHGFIPVVVPDACGDRDARVHQANLFDLAAKYADVVDSAEVIAWLSDHASTARPR